MKATEDYHEMQKCEYYQSEQCDCLTECSFVKKQERKDLLIEMMQEDEKNGMYKESQEELWSELLKTMSFFPSPKYLIEVKEKFTITRK